MLLCCLLRAAHTPGGIPHPATPPLGALPTACALCTAIEALSFTIVDPSLPSFPPNIWRLRTPPAAALSVFGGYGAVQRGGVDVCVNAMVVRDLYLSLPRLTLVCDYAASGIGIQWRLSVIKGSGRSFRSPPNLWQVRGNAPCSPRFSRGRSTC